MTREQFERIVSIWRGAPHSICVTLIGGAEAVGHWCYLDEAREIIEIEPPKRELAPSRTYVDIASIMAVSVYDEAV